MQVARTLTFPVNGATTLIRTMKRFASPVLVALLIAFVFTPLASAAASPAVPARSNDKSPAAAISGAISTVTGVAISPLLGTAGYGAYRWVTTKEEARAALPWYCQASFWLPALIIVGI